MMMVRRLSATVGLVLLIFAATVVAFAGRGPGAEDAAGHGFDTGNLDRTCKPCDDFFQFAEGGWTKNNPIPPEYPEWGSFVTLGDKNEKSLHEILEAAAANGASAAGSNEQKIGDYYATCMDTKAIEGQGLKPLADDLRKIEGIHDTASLVDTGAHLQGEGVGVLFAFGSDQDFKDSSKVIGEANQGGLGLPDRDYYTRDDDDSKKLRQQYVEHIAKLLTLMGDAQEGKAVLALETSLAKASLNNVDLRDPQKVYHKMSVADAQALTPHLSWEAYFHAAGGPELTEINIGEPDFFKALDGMLITVPLADWKTYYRWQLIDRSARLLSDAFVQENFNFNGRILTGTKEIRARWNWEKCWDRSTYRNIFRRKPKGEPSNWCTTCSRRFMMICKRWTG